MQVPCDTDRNALSQVWHSTLDTETWLEIIQKRKYLQDISHHNKNLEEWTIQNGQMMFLIPCMGA
jgi:hypothetical protein